MMRRLLNILVALFELFIMFVGIAMLPAWLNAQEQRFHPASEPAAVALHERHDRATGTARPTPHEHLIMEMQTAGAAPIRTETFLTQPDRIFVRTEVAGKLIMEFGYDGVTGWSNSPGTGLVRLPKPALEVLRASAGSMSAPALDSSAPIRATGRRTFDEQLVDGIRSVSAEGDTAEVYYADSTALMAGMRIRRAGVPGGAPGDSLPILLRDYKRIDGRMEHMTSVSRGMGMSGVARTVHLDHEPIDPGRFKPPVGLP